MKIPEPRFLLKNPKSNNKTLISMVVRFMNKRLFYSTGEVINPRHWDFVRQRAKTGKMNIDGVEINLILDKLSTDTKRIFREYKLLGKQITVSKLRKEVDNILAGKKSKVEFHQFVNDYIEDSKKTKKIGTIKIYKTSLKHLTEFSKKARRELLFSNIDTDFYHDYKNYLIMDKNMALNTVGKQIRVLKTFMNAAFEKGIHQIDDFKHFKKMQEKVSKIYLNDEEIQRIYKRKFEYMPIWEDVKNLFVIGCYTGLRFSDLANLSNDHIKKIDGVEYIEIITQKTNEKVVIPVHPIVKEILTTYNNKLPRMISNQKFNQYLKYIGRYAGIDEIVEVNKTIGGKNKTMTFKKYELITAHCARRSMATNMFLAQIPTLNIMKITGHKSERVFLDYICASPEENAIKLSEHLFFN